MRAPQRLDGFLPAVLKLLGLDPVLFRQAFDLRFVLLDDLVHELLLPSPRPELLQEEKSDPQPDQAEQEEDPDPPWPIQEQDAAKNEQHYQDDRGDDEEPFKEF